MLILLILGQDFKKQSIGNQYSSTAAAARSLQSCPTLCDPSMGFSRQEYWSGVPLPSSSIHLGCFLCQVVRIGKRSPKWGWLKDKEGKSPRKQNKGRSKKGPRTGVRTSGRTNSTPGQPNYIRQAPGGREKHIKRGAKGSGLSLLFVSLDQHALAPRRCIFLLFSK